LNLKITLLAFIHRVDTEFL